MQKLRKSHYWSPLWVLYERWVLIIFFSFLTKRNKWSIFIFHSVKKYFIGVPHVSHLKLIIWYFAGYHGNPVNGGKCTPCNCNNRADDCNRESGKCYCTTKGIIGDQCEKCDTTNHYHSDPSSNKSCYCECKLLSFYIILLTVVVVLFMTNRNIYKETV